LVFKQGKKIKPLLAVVYAQGDESIYVQQKGNTIPKNSIALNQQLIKVINCFGRLQLPKNQN